MHARADQGIHLHHEGDEPNEPAAGGRQQDAASYDRALLEANGDDASNDGEQGPEYGECYKTNVFVHVDSE